MQGRHAPHHSQIQSHFNSLRRLTPLLPFPPLPPHHHKQLQRVQPGSKAHRQQQQQHVRQNNGKKRELDKGGVATLSRTKVTPSFLRLPAERMPGYQTFQLHEVIPRNFQEVTIPASHKNCANLSGAPLCGGTYIIGASARGEQRLKV